MKTTYPHIEFFFSETPAAGYSGKPAYGLVLDLKDGKLYAISAYDEVSSKTNRMRYPYMNSWDGHKPIFKRPKKDNSFFIFSSISTMGVHGVTPHMLKELRESKKPKVHPDAIQHLQILFDSYGQGKHTQVYQEYIDEGVRNSAALATAPKPKSKPAHKTAVSTAALAAKRTQRT